MKIVDLIRSKSLFDAVDIKKDDVVSVVGAGGKTSFCLNLCEELKNNLKVIYTTTTKMYPPEYRNLYNLIYKSHLNECDFYENGIYIVGKELNEDNKIVSLDLSEVINLKNKCDLLIIEADGSKKKPLKGWESFEPVVVNSTSKTIGVLDITAVNSIISEDNIHRVNIFCHISKGKYLEKVNINHLFSLVTHKEGIFKDSKGEKILYINKVESRKALDDALELIKLLRSSNVSITRYVIGSLQNKKYGYTVGRVNEN